MDLFLVAVCVCVCVCVRVCVCVCVCVFVCVLVCGKEDAKIGKAVEEFVKLSFQESYISYKDQVFIRGIRGHTLSFMAKSTGPW